MANQYDKANHLIQKIKSCQECAAQLPHAPRPVVSFNAQSKIALIGQAPGSIVHRTGIPWDDKSGQNLRSWMGMDSTGFYDPNILAIVPMGFCYPGKGKTGDLPPRKECAPLWHNQIFDLIPNIQLSLLIGKYAQDYYLKDKQRSLTQRVLHFEEYLPEYFVLPHPSPRNNIWMKKNPWFKKDVLPVLKKRVEIALH